MKKGLIGLAIIIIIGAGAYFLSKPNSAVAPAQLAATNNAPVGMQSLGALVSAGTPVTCSFSTTTPNGTTQGTMYIANGMVAGDFTSNMGSQGPIDGHMLVRDNTSYVWTSLSSTGYKSTVTASTTAGGSKGVDYNAKMDYSCQTWTVDSGKFTLPTNISFMTTSSYTPPPQGAGATGAAPATGAPKGSAAMCAECNSLPSAQKAQCLAALQC
jgi:hypothetical protein